MSSGLYGVFLGIAFIVFTKLVPQPFASAALIAGAIMSTCALILAVVGHPYPRWPPESWVLFGGGAVLGPLFLFIESRVNRAKWKQWAQHMERQRVWDIVTGRHFPQLRNGGA